MSERDKHQPQPHGERRADSASETGKPFTAIGAGCGGFLFLALGFASQVAAGTMWTSEYFVMRLLLPAVVGVLLGSSIGWAIGITRTRRDVSRSKLIVAWSLLGGWVALLPAYAIAVVGVFSGELRLSPVPGHAHQPGLAGVIESLLGGAIVLVLFGPPVFAFGAIVGTGIALVKWSRKQNQKLAPPSA